MTTAVTGSPKAAAAKDILARLQGVSFNSPHAPFHLDPPAVWLNRFGPIGVHYECSFLKIPEQFSPFF